MASGTGAFIRVGNLTIEGLGAEADQRVYFDEARRRLPDVTGTEASRVARHHHRRRR
jgi:hypothetical protein